MIISMSIHAAADLRFSSHNESVCFHVCVLWWGCSHMVGLSFWAQGGRVLFLGTILGARVYILFFCQSFPQQP